MSRLLPLAMQPQYQITPSAGGFNFWNPEQTGVMLLDLRQEIRG